MPDYDDSCIGEIRIWPIPFAPVNWRFCDGAILNIAQYTSLFSLIGFNFGGNLQTTFALPDLRGRVVTGVDSSILLAQPGGVESSFQSPANAAAGTDTNLMAATGESSIDTRQPYMALNFIICVNGNYPQRS